MTGAAIGLIVVVACAAYYVISRGKRPHATGAFRNRPSNEPPIPGLDPDEDPESGGGPTSTR